MAQLGKEYPFPKYENFQDWKEFDKAQNEAFEKIPKDRIIEFPVADGYACYYIGSLDPLVLRFIPCYDQYQIPMAYIRGLRKADIEQMIARKKAFEEIFTK